MVIFAFLRGEMGRSVVKRVIFNLNIVKMIVKFAVFIFVLVNLTVKFAIFLLKRPFLTARSIDLELQNVISSILPHESPFYNGKTYKIHSFRIFKRIISGHICFFISFTA